MTKAKAIELAKVEAKKAKVEIVVVDAPIENAEDESGPFGYCPAEAKDVLFANGTVVARISRHGVEMGM